MLTLNNILIHSIPCSYLMRKLALQTFTQYSNAGKCRLGILCN